MNILQSTVKRSQQAIQLAMLIMAMTLIPVAQLSTSL